MIAKIPTGIVDETDWAALCNWMLDECGLGFHPDTDIAQYVRVDSAKTLFSGAKVRRLQPLLEQARAGIAEDRMFEIAFDLMQKHFPSLWTQRQ